MDWEFFDSLSLDEASAFLSAFLRAERSAAEGMVKAARRDGVAADFSVETLPDVMRWALHHLELVPKRADSSLPSWITSTEEYRRGLFSFSEKSKPLVLRVGYYFGECFVRTFPVLRWSVGHPETAERNMPVVTGFGNQIELAPILVAENLFRRALSGDGSSDAIDQAVNRWVAYLTRS